MPGEITCRDGVPPPGAGDGGRNGDAGDVARGRARRLALAAGLGGIVAGWVTFATIGLIAGHGVLADRERELARWQGAYADLFARFRREAAAGDDRLGGLRAELARAQAAERAATAHVADFSARLRERMADVEAEFAALAEERDAALRLARSLGAGLDEAREWLGAAALERDRLAAELAAAGSLAAAVAHERDAARREGVGASRHAERLEAEVERLRSEREATLARLQAWVGEQVEALELLFADTGLDPERLIARSAAEPGAEGGDAAGGQGGPLRVALQSSDVEVYTGGAGGAIAAALEPGVGDALGRMLALRRLLAGLPLAAPLDHFRVSSRFGERTDPFTKGRALHEGLDFTAARGATVLATAPGRVIRAGPAGAYGNMVEVDHGLGVVTRYGHLKAITVEAGDRVTFRHELGIIGSTGRSTGRHLHYEVRVDGEPHDPAKFLNAGRRLIHVFQG